MKSYIFLGKEIQSVSEFNTGIYGVKFLPKPASKWDKPGCELASQCMKYSNRMICKWKVKSCYWFEKIPKIFNQNYIKDNL